MDIRLILVQAFAIFFAITVHEAAHAWTANRLGDPTAAALGRASLNPLVHIDLFGTIILPLVLIFFSFSPEEGPPFSAGPSPSLTTPATYAIPARTVCGSRSPARSPT